jgi:hypothetical protein
VNPLVIASGVGKRIDPLLADGDPIGHAQFLAYSRHGCSGGI